MGRPCNCCGPVGCPPIEDHVAIENAVNEHVTREDSGADALPTLTLAGMNSRDSGDNYAAVTDTAVTITPETNDAGDVYLRVDIEYTEPAGSLYWFDVYLDFGATPYDYTTAFDAGFAEYVAMKYAFRHGYLTSGAAELEGFSGVLNGFAQPPTLDDIELSVGGALLEADNVTAKETGGVTVADCWEDVEIEIGTQGGECLPEKDPDPRRPGIFRPVIRIRHRTRIAGAISGQVRKFSYMVAQTSWERRRSDYFANQLLDGYSFVTAPADGTDGWFGDRVTGGGLGGGGTGSLFDPAHSAAAYSFTPADTLTAESAGMTITMRHVYQTRTLTAFYNEAWISLSYKALDCVSDAGDVFAWEGSVQDPDYDRVEWYILWMPSRKRTTERAASLQPLRDSFRNFAGLTGFYTITTYGPEPTPPNTVAVEYHGDRPESVTLPWRPAPIYKSGNAFEATFTLRRGKRFWSIARD